MNTLILIVALDLTMTGWWYGGWAVTPIVLPILAMLALYSQSYDADDDADDGRYRHLYDQSMRTRR